jgi:hypothetical protein
MAEACGLSYDHVAAEGIEPGTAEGVEISIATKETLVRTKATIRDSDRSGVEAYRPGGRDVENFLVSTEK